MFVRLPLASVSIVCDGHDKRSAAVGIGLRQPLASQNGDSGILEIAGSADRRLQFSAVPLASNAWSQRKDRRSLVGSAIKENHF